MGPIAQLGVVVGTMVGSAAGPTAVTTPRPFLFGLGLAVKAVFIGLALYLAGAMTIAVAGGGAIDAGAIAFVVFAVPTALALALPVTGPIALAAMAVARVTRRHRRRGVLALAAIVLATAALTVAASQDPPRGRDPGLGAAIGQVQLEWTVVNRSDDDLLLSVWARTGDGAGGSSRGLPACFTATGRSWEEADWFIGLENDRTANEGAIPDAVVSASDVPGSEPRVWIDVAPDGELTVIPGRAAPAADQLIVDHCLKASE